MSRIRTIKPDMFGSYTLASLSIEARYLFVGLFTEADDHGRLIDSPKRIAGAIFPHDEKVTSTMVDKWLSDLEKVGCITRYETDGGRYIFFPKWTKHQKISHPAPSKLPNSSGSSPEVLRSEGEGERDLEKPCDPEAGHVDVPDDFPNFWDRYPKRNGKKLGKVTTRKLWVKLNNVERALAISAVEHYAAACNSDLTLPKDPERWLKGRCWDDWQEPAKVTAPTRAVGGVLAGSVSFDESYYGRSQR